MSSSFPTALFDATDAASPPPASGTVVVSDDYTLAGGDSVDIVDPTGFDITVTDIHFEIDGTATVTSAAATVIGVSSAVGDGGALAMSIGVGGSLTVTGSAEDAVVTGVQTEDIDADFVNRGALSVSADLGAAYGMVTHISEGHLDNRGTLEVSAHDQAFGIYIDSNTHSFNDGTIRV
jgi:hypothetical protein